MDSLKNKFSKRIFKIASRTSELALSQVYEVNIFKLQKLSFKVINSLIQIKELGLTKENFQIVPVSSSEGDQNLKDPLYMIGGVGVFTKNVEIELKNKNADFAVHSLKDLPTDIDPDLYIAAIPELMPRSDVFISSKKNNNKRIEELPKNSIVGTSSLRRSTSLKYRFPDIEFKNIRGNLNTRIRKLDENEYDGIILAHAGLKRLNLESRITQYFKEDEYLYAPGQGALGIECRKDDEDSKELLKFIDNKFARVRCEVERQFLNKLEGGCKLPIAVYTEIIDEKEIILVGQVWDIDGKLTLKNQIKSDINDRFIGEKLANIMKLEGAEEIIKKIKHENKIKI